MSQPPTHLQLGDGRRDRCNSKGVTEICNLPPPSDFSTLTKPTSNTEMQFRVAFKSPFCWTENKLAHTGLAQPQTGPWSRPPQQHFRAGETKQQNPFPYALKFMPLYCPTALYLLKLFSSIVPHERKKKSPNQRVSCIPCWQNTFSSNLSSYWGRKREREGLEQE